MSVQVRAAVVNVCCTRQLGKGRILHGVLDLAEQVVKFSGIL